MLNNCTNTAQGSANAASQATVYLGEAIPVVAKWYVTIIPADYSSRLNQRGELRSQFDEIIYVAPCVSNENDNGSLELIIGISRI